MTRSPSPPVSLPPHQPPINDPPPPYPTRERRTRTSRSTRRLNSQHAPLSPTESDYDALSSPLPFPALEESVPDVTATETTPLISPPNGRNPNGRTLNRPRTVSYTSTLLSSNSAAPSLAQTLVSLFQPEPESEFEGSNGEFEGSQLLHVHEADGLHCVNEFDRIRSRYSRTWRRYFRPMTRMVYYRSLFHLLVLNFPFALAAWVYLFVFTLAGTTLLMALPLGAILCFFDLLGARVFARGELALQTRFHSPLSVPAPHPPRPIFTRMREPPSSVTSLETGVIPQPQYESSFYKNTYAMFTDSTSYQALFYFLVIKPGITLLFTIALLVTVPLAFLLILPAPAMLCAVRRLGVWQANVAVEGLYFAVS